MEISESQKTQELQENASLLSQSQKEAHTDTEMIITHLKQGEQLEDELMHS